MGNMEPADHIELTALAARYAHAVDRRNTSTLVSLFTPDATVVLPPGLSGSDAPRELRGNEVVADAVISALAHLHATRHVVDQQTVAPAGPGTADGETYCTAHHIYSRGSSHRDNRIAIRYQETFARVGGVWLFSRRELVVDFAEDVPVSLMS